MVSHINEKEFNDEVIKQKGVVLVDFFATWCPPCKMLAPVLEEISESRGNFKIVKINVDENLAISTKYDIRAVPTMIVFKDGKIVDTAYGYLPKEKVVDLLNNHI